MIYRLFGSTGLQVSAIGFGGMRFLDQNDVDGCSTLLKIAYDKGINYFDTAPGYGKSEDLFGVALKEMLKTRTQKPFYVSTKTFKSKPDEIQKDLETSLKRLNLDYIDFYHVWCVLTPDEYFQRKADGMLPKLESLKQQRLVKHICLSTHMTGPDIGKVLADYPFASVLLGYSAMNFPYRDEGLSAASKLGRAVVVMNPLAGGLIPQNPERFEFVKTRHDETVTQAALRFLVNDPRITVALVGFSKPSHIDESISAVDGFKPISKDAVVKIRANLKKSFNELCTVCRYCWDSCPKGIPVTKMMESYNHYLLTGKAELIPFRMRDHWGIDLRNTLLDKCSQCGSCESDCTQKLEIRKRLQFIREAVEKYLQEHPQAE